jgi:tetratricopeptide (TPR) repeat protein
MRDILDGGEMINIKFRRIFLFAFIILFMIQSAIAQEGKGQGRLVGIVQDESGVPLANAEIIIESLRFKELVFKTTTDEDGKWAILGLGTGMHRVNVSYQGYYPAYQDIDVKQLERNPEVIFALKRIEQSEMSIISDEASMEIFEQGNQFFAEKKFDDAILAFTQFLEINPMAFQVHINLGNAYKEKGELDKAREQYQKFLDAAEGKEEETGHKELIAKALAGTGECYLKEDDLENAQKYFKEAIEIYPKDESLAHNVGEIYFSNNKVDEAIQYFQLSKEIKPDWEKPYIKLGYAYLNKGEFKLAKENLEKFLEIKPDSPQAPTVKNIIQYLETQIK